jgi:hypothetical protein
LPVFFSEQLAEHVFAAAHFAFSAAEHVFAVVHFAEVVQAAFFEAGFSCALALTENAMAIKTAVMIFFIFVDLKFRITAWQKSPALPVQKRMPEFWTEVVM